MREPYKTDWGIFKDIAFNILAFFLALAICAGVGMFFLWTEGEDPPESHYSEVMDNNGVREQDAP